MCSPVGMFLGILYCWLIVTCSDDDDEILQNEDLPEVEIGFANTIVVDNLPVVPPEKFERLGDIIRKIFSCTSAIKGGFWMPVNEDTNMTYGYCFIEYNTPQVVCFCQSHLFSYIFIFERCYGFRWFYCLTSHPWGMCPNLCSYNLNHTLLIRVVLYQHTSQYISCRIYEYNCSACTSQLRCMCFWYPYNWQKYLNSSTHLFFLPPSWV